MIEAMERSGSVQTRAAEILGMTFRSFRYFAKSTASRRARPGTAPTPLPTRRPRTSGRVGSARRLTSS